MLMENIKVIQNQKLIKSKSSKRKINKKDSNSGNLLKAFATNEISANNNKKKITLLSDRKFPPLRPRPFEESKLVSE